MRIFFILFVALVAGCATVGGNTMKVAGAYEQKTVHLDPIGFVGVQMTPAIEHNNYQAYLANFPDGFFPEFDPLRFRYNAVAYGIESGQEYPAQAIYAGYANCALRLVLLVEDASEPVVAVFVSTRFTRMFNLFGEEVDVSEPDRLVSDPVYRRDIVLSQGTRVSRMAEMAVLKSGGIRDIFALWNTVRVKALPYEIRTPLSQELVKLVVRDNPELNFSEKLVGNGHFAINPMSWFSTAASAVADVYTATQAADKGWDENSELKRGYQGMLARAMKAQLDAAIKAGMVCSSPPSTSASLH